MINPAMIKREYAVSVVKTRNKEITRSFSDSQVVVLEEESKQSTTTSQKRQITAKTVSTNLYEFPIAKCRRSNIEICGSSKLPLVTGTIDRDEDDVKENIPSLYWYLIVYGFFMCSANRRPRMAGRTPRLTTPMNYVSAQIQCTEPPSSLSTPHTASTSMSNIEASYPSNNGSCVADRFRESLSLLVYFWLNAR